MKTITVFKGDGIGPEITDAVLDILKAAKAPLDYEIFQVGLPLYEECGELVSPEAFASFEKNKILLKSPITTPVGSGFRSINVLLRKKYVTKNYIFAKPTIEELRARGFSNRGAAVILSVYNSINAKPAKGFEETKENQQKYFNIIHRTMDNVIAYVREHQQEIDAWNMGMDTNVDMLRAVFPSDETIINRIFRTNKEYNTEALIAGGNKFINSMIISGYDLSKIDEN